jgi:hypothetical protein
MTHLMTSLLALERGLQHEHANGNLHTIVSQFSEQLHDILSEVEILLREPNVRPMNGRLIGFRNRVFRRLLPDIQNLRVSQHVTRVFNAFVRGITYFQPEEVFHPFQPVYHRLGSCMPRGIDNPRCLPENTSNTRRVKKTHIEKCYIERCIYDALWSRFVGTQDEGHLNWLHNTKQAYHTCYLDTDLDVRVQFDVNTNLPTGLRVSAHSITYGRLLWTLQYKKYVSMNHSLYDPNVVCIKHEHGMVSTKINTFELEASWVQR